MITNIKEKNKYCRENHNKVLTIVMNEDFETDPEYSKIANYSLKLFKWQEYDVEIVKYDSHSNEDLAVSLFFMNNKENEQNVELTLKQFKKFHEKYEDSFKQYAEAVYLKF